MSFVFIHNAKGIKTEVFAGLLGKARAMYPPCYIPLLAKNLHICSELLNISCNASITWAD